MPSIARRRPNPRAACQADLASPLTDSEMTHQAEWLATATGEIELSAPERSSENHQMGYFARLLDT